MLLRRGRYSRDAISIVHASAVLFLLAGNARIVTSAAASEWFQGEGADCSGVQMLGDAISAMTGGGVSVQAGDNPGYYFVLIPVDMSVNYIGRDRIENLTTLDPARAKTLQGLFNTVSADTKVPAFAVVGTALFTDLVLPAKTWNREWFDF